MPEVSASKYLIGPCTIIFRGQTLLFAEKVEVSFEPSVLELPGVMESAGPLGYLPTKREIKVKVATKHISLDTFEMMSGFWGDRGRAGSAEWVNLGEGNYSLPTGSLTIIGKTVDGTPVRLYLANAQAVPIANTTAFSPTEPAQWNIQFVKIAPTTGSLISGRFQLGDIE